MDNKQDIMNDQSVLKIHEIEAITETIDDKVNIPLMKKYFEEYQRTSAYGLPKEYYIGYVRGMYKQIKNGSK